MTNNEFKDRIFIFSVFQGKDFYQDIFNHRTVINRLARLEVPFKVVKGIFAGSKELSFVVLEKDCPKDFVVKWTKLTNQQCFLELERKELAHKVKKAKFVTPDGSTLEDGFFKQRSREVALSAKGYTYDPRTRAYFVVEPTACAVVK